jgi:hypothetical protein
MVISSSKKMDLLIQFLPSLPHISGDSPPKNYQAWVFREGFFELICGKGKKKAFSKG